MCAKVAGFWSFQEPYADNKDFCHMWADLEHGLDGEY